MGRSRQHVSIILKEAPASTFHAVAEQDACNRKAITRKPITLPAYDSQDGVQQLHGERPPTQIYILMVYLEKYDERILRFENNMLDQEK